MSNKTSPKKEKPVKGSGEPLTPKEINAGKEEEREEIKEKYVIQINRGTTEDTYATVKKEGKVYVTTDKTKAEEIAAKLIGKHTDILAVRICRVKDNTLMPETEITGRDAIIKNKTALPEEMRGVIQPDMLDYMNEEEITSIRNLIAEYLRKKQEIETFSRLAVQRSAFKRDKQNMERLEEITKRYRDTKERYEAIKEEWDTVKQDVEGFIEEYERKYPAIGRWLRIEITGVGRAIRRTSGRQRVTGGKRQLILQFLRDNKGRKFSEKEIREKLKEMYSDYSWSQQSCWAPLKSLREEGLISQDEQGRYYLP